MGIWGKLSAPFKGEPNLKTEQNRTKDPFAKGYANRGNQADQATWALLRDELNRTPGYTPEERRQMEEVPIEAQKYGEQGDIRAMNRMAGANNAFGSGGRMEAEGLTRTEGRRTRARIKTNVAGSAAQFARMDRQQQIQTGSGYALPRQEIGMRETQADNAWKQHLNEINLQNFLAELGQYNKNYDDGMDMWSKIIMAAGGACHVAAVVYGGWDAPEVRPVRRWIFDEAPVWFRTWYVDHAPEVAATIAVGSTTLRAIWKRFFDEVLESGSPSFYPAMSKED